MTVKYEHLVGLEFDIEKQNCFTIIRQFYQDNYGIELPDIPCPTDWWSKGLDLYAQLAPKFGFQIIHDHPRDWREGDVILMAIQSSTGNHTGIVLDNGKLLHHLFGQRSVVTNYGGLFRNTTVGVYRHVDVPKTSSVQTVDFRDLALPAHIRRRVEELQASQQGAPEEAGD